MSKKHVSKTDAGGDQNTFKACFQPAPAINRDSFRPFDGQAARDPECMRVAHRLVGSTKRSIVLLPTSTELDIFRVVVELGQCLAAVSSSNVAIVDPGGGDEGPLESVAPAVAPVKGRWLTPTLALIEPARKPLAGQAVAELARLVQYTKGRTVFVIGTLPVLSADAELFSALALFDGACVVAVAGATRESELLRVSRLLPAAQNLGVLLLTK